MSECPQQQMKTMNEKHFVVHPTWLVTSIMELFRKMFYLSTTESSTWNSSSRGDKEKSLSSNGLSGCSSTSSYMSNGKPHGRIGMSFPRSKRRYSSSRRDIKVVDLGVYNNCGRDKRRGNSKIGSSSSRDNCSQGEWTNTTIVSQTAWSLYTLVAIISILSYLNSFHGDFVHDDLSAIKTNGDVTGQNEIWEIFFNDFWGKSMADRTSHKSYRPLTILTFRLNALLHDLEPMGFHITNVILHSAVCTIFIKVCLEVVRTSRTSAVIAAVHFAVHPIHTEAVTGIVGRADVLASVFVLLSFLYYHRCQREGESQRFVVLSVILAFGAMLSKEHGITVLGINFTWDVYLHRRLISNYLYNRKRNLRMDQLFRRLFIVGFASLAFMSFRVIIQHGSLPQFSDQDNPASFASSRATRFRTFAYLPAFNFWLLLAPVSLNYDWQMGSIPLVQRWTDARNINIVLFYSFLLWTIFHSKGRVRRDMIVGLTFLIIPFIPASNLLFRVGFVVAERILYIPSMGFSLLVGVGAERIMTLQKSTFRVNLVKVIILMVLTLFAYKTWQRNMDWSNRESLFTSGLRLLPHNAKMHYNYANLQKDLGRTEEAILHYRQALSLWPHHASAHNNLGTLLNDSKEAETHFQQALRINPLHAHAFFNLANLKHQQGQTNLAVRFMERSLELEQKNPDALTNLAAMYADLGQLNRAKEIHLKILQLEVNSADHLNNYAAFLQKIGRVEEALSFYQEALLRDANHTVALLNTARLLKKLKFNEKAESLYQRALLRDDDPQTKDGLGVLYLNTGRANQAERLFREALQHRPNDPIVKVHLAQAQVHQRKYNEAEALLLSVMEQSKQSNSSRREVLHQLATLYSHLNRTNDAVRYIQLALGTCTISDITCAPMHAFHGDLSKDVEDLDSAIQSYKIAVDMLMQSRDCCSQQKYSASSNIITHVHLNLGAIYHVQGKFKDAWKHYNEALAQDPNNSVLQQNMDKLRKAESQHKNSSCNDDQFMARRHIIRQR